MAGLIALIGRHAQVTSLKILGQGNVYRDPYWESNERDEIGSCISVGYAC
jgi:hypothetical protein